LYGTQPDDTHMWIGKKNITGRVIGYIPYIGYPTIILNDKPNLKWVIIALMTILILTSKDPIDEEDKPNTPYQ
jgi:hypothetical protein